MRNEIDRVKKGYGTEMKIVERFSSHSHYTISVSFDFCPWEGNVRTFVLINEN